MKKISILVLIIICQLSFSQSKKKSVPPPPKKAVFSPPKILPPPVKPISKPKPINKIVSIVKDNEIPLTFKYEINKDTIILPKSEFSEIVELYNYDSYLDNLDVTLISRTASDTMKFEFNDGTKGERWLYSFYEDRKWCKATVSKNRLTVVDKETKIKVDFNVVLDKAKKNILYLENVATKRKYLPTRYEAPPPKGF